MHLFTLKSEVYRENGSKIFGGVRTVRTRGSHYKVQHEKLPLGYEEKHLHCELVEQLEQVVLRKTEVFGV